MALLEVEGVSVSYGVVVAVHHLDLTVNEGEVVCLLGANGAGKTTTLRAISGVVRPREGRIFFAGRRLDGLRPEKVASLGIAHLPEGRGIFGSLTVRENLEMGAYGEGIPRRRVGEEVERVLQIFPALKTRLSQQAGTMSGGEQQMLGLARALISRPRLLMVDELSFGLAPRIVQSLFAHVREVAKSGTAVLLVEQFVGEALAISSRAYVMEKGRVVFSGPSEELRTRSGFVEEFYLGREARARTALDGQGRAKEEVRLLLPGGLWREVEVAAARASRSVEEFVIEGLGKVLGVSERDEPTALLPPLRESRAGRRPAEPRGRRQEKGTRRERRGGQNGS